MYAWKLFRPTTLLCSACVCVCARVYAQKGYKVQVSFGEKTILYAEEGKDGTRQPQDVVRRGVLFIPRRCKQVQVIDDPFCRWTSIYGLSFACQSNTNRRAAAAFLVDGGPPWCENKIQQTPIMFFFREKLPQSVVWHPQQHHRRWIFTCGQNISCARFNIFFVVYASVLICIFGIEGCQANALISEQIVFFDVRQTV